VLFRRVTMNDVTGIQVIRGERNPAELEDECTAWRENRKLTLESHGRDIALAVALRPLRRARTHWQILFAIEEVLVRYIGVDAYAVLDPPDAPKCVRSFRSMEDHELLAFLEPAPGRPPKKVLALYPLGTKALTLGSVAICRLMPGKQELDEFDHALLQALGAQTALALRVCEDLAHRPTSRPPKP
jgi:hypothetical protein